MYILYDACYRNTSRQLSLKEMVHAWRVSSLSSYGCMREVGRA